MSPLDNFVVDTNDGCDVVCNGCMVYELADQSLRGSSKTVNVPVVRQLGKRINEHAVAHELEEVNVILFGGEPLLRGGKHVDMVAETLNGEVTDAQIVYRATTNGMRYRKDPELREVVAKHGIRLGFSVNGYKAVHDSTRRHYNGSGTFDEVAEAIDIVRTQYPENYSGILCTLLDPDSDPELTQQTLYDLRPPNMDYLFDHGMAGKRRPHDRFEDRPTETPYGDWLVRAFEYWNEYSYHPASYEYSLYNGPYEYIPGVRLFDAIIGMFRDKPEMGYSVQAGARNPWSVVAITTDGRIRNDPGYNACFEGAAETGMNVFHHSFDDVLRYPSFVQAQLGKAGLGKTCQECPIVDKCGGGFPAHRYWNENPAREPSEYIADMFKYPSYYCADITKLIEHIAAVMGKDPYSDIRIG
ncbi:MAG TPA: radical SAM protein [Candidatus Saccharimonadales bacterium]|nr:radical SAM protein [Candidatus Saccharimonadales bacterium]